MIKLVIKVELNKLMCYTTGASRTIPNMFICSLVFSGGSWCCDATAIVRSLLCARKILLCYVYFFWSLPITLPSPNDLIIWFIQVIRILRPFLTYHIPDPEPFNKRTLEAHSCCAHFMARLKILLCYVQVSCGVIWYV